MNNPVLSICIPTFNRADYLRVCLGSIIDQVRDPQTQAEVEIVVSDNASSDNTESVVLEARKKFLNLVYVKNSENLFVDRNILGSVAHAHGEFAWLLGDDDALFPGAIAYMLGKIKEEKFDYTIVNCWGYTHDLSEQAVNRPNMSEGQDKYFAEPGEYIKNSSSDKELVGMFCGLSEQIFRRSLWAELPGKEQYIGSNAVHLHVLLTAMENKRFAILSKPLVKVRAANIRWDVFPGLETLQKRAQSTTRLLLWILERYHVPHSNFTIRLTYYKDLSSSWVDNTLRKTIFKSQRSRDMIKKIMGKL